MKVPFTLFVLRLQDMNRYFSFAGNFVRFGDDLIKIIRTSQLFDVLSNRD